MKKFRLLILFFTVLYAAAAHAQTIEIGVDFDTYLNNREFGTGPPLGYGIDGESGTTFASRLTPIIKLGWEQKNKLVFGVEMYQNFGERSPKFLSEVKPLIYYQFKTQNVKAIAGIFDREQTHSDDYSVAFFTGNYKFVCNRMNGVMAQYNSGRSYVELICDWEGMYSVESREKFRILSSGRHQLKNFYYGYNLTLFHFAKKRNNPNTEVVDFMLVNPCVGVKFNAFFAFDIKLGLMQTMQRDRATDGGWKAPRMGELRVRMSRWGFAIDQQLFVGQNIYPFFAGHKYADGAITPYGHELYPGPGYFFSADKMYSCTTLSYAKWFFNNTVGVKGLLLNHYDRRSFGTQQILQVSVRFLKTVYNSNTHKK